MGGKIALLPRAGLVGGGCSAVERGAVRWLPLLCQLDASCRRARDDVKRLELNYLHVGKFARSAQEFAVYIRSNAGNLINDRERFRAGERISSAMAESTVNAMVSKRFAKRQRMQ